MAGKADSQDNAAAIAPIAWLIVIYWIAQFAILTAQRFLWSEGTEPLIYLVPRGFMSIVGVGISFAIAAWQRRHSELTWGRRLGLALLAALIAAPLHAAINFAAFQIVMPDENMSSTTAASILMGMLNWFWTYAAIAALLLTASYNDALRERERRLSDMQGLAHAAQLRSLRYQLNPHFMFNTLNSVTALIAGGRSDQAEHMGDRFLAPRRQGISPCAAEQDAIGAEREHPYHVQAGANAAIDQDRQPAGDHVRNRRQRASGREGSVQLAPAMVGDDDSVRPRFGGQTRILGIQNALDHDRARPV